MRSGYVASSKDETLTGGWMSSSATGIAIRKASMNFVSTHCVWSSAVTFIDGFSDTEMSGPVNALWIRGDYVLSDVLMIQHWEKRIISAKSLVRYVSRMSRLRLLHELRLCADKSLIELHEFRYLQNSASGWLKQIMQLCLLTFSFDAILQHFAIPLLKRRIGCNGMQKYFLS